MTQREIVFRNRNLPLLLLKGRELVVSNFRPLLQAQGITEQQWRVVRLLVERGSLEQCEIGRLCNFSAPSLTGVLSRMVGLGLVKRRRFESDKRRMTVMLTPRAFSLAAKFAPHIDAIYRQLRIQVGEELYAELTDVMDRFIQRLESDPEPPVTRPKSRGVGPK